LQDLSHRGDFFQLNRSIFVDSGGAHHHHTLSCSNTPTINQIAWGGIASIRATQSLVYFQTKKKKEINHR
jgi:hypothetical protein